MPAHRMIGRPSVRLTEASINGVHDKIAAEIMKACNGKPNEHVLRHLTELRTAADEAVADLDLGD